MWSILSSRRSCRFLFTARWQRDIRRSGPEEADRLRISHDIEYHDLIFSKGWLQSLKGWNNIKSCALTGDSGIHVLKKRKEQSLDFDIRSSIISKWCFIYNETKLFYDLPTNKILYGSIQWREERKCTDDSSPCCNASGAKKMDPWSSESLKPRCFKAVEIEMRGIIYDANSNACTTGIIFDMWLHQINLWMHDLKELLFLYNAFSHKVWRELNSVTVVFSRLTRITPSERSM